LDQKKTILRNKLKLRGQENPAHIHRHFVTPDLTTSEQKENKDLRLKLAQMNKNGKKYKIINGQTCNAEGGLDLTSCTVTTPLSDYFYYNTEINNVLV